MLPAEPVRDAALRRRTTNHAQEDNNNDSNSDSNNTAADAASSPGTTTIQQQGHQPEPSTDSKVHYNGRSYAGTGRLPRDAPFTPTYVNVYTVNSAIAFVSLVVTATFFYFKIIAGILESPQIGPDREFLSTHMGPPDGGELRPLQIPLCPTSQQMQDRSQQQQQQQWSTSKMTGSDDDCVLFGKIVILADSIAKYGYTHATQGWLGFLTDEWAGRADIVLRSFPESKSSSTAPVKLVVIALGTDDASFPHTRQHVALDAYKDNLRSLISTIRYPESPHYSPDTQVILTTPAPVHDTMWEASVTGISRPVDHSNNVTKDYADACVEVGQELNVPVVNIWSEIMCQVEGTCPLHESDQLEDYLMDGLNLKRMGNEVLYKGIMNAVAEHYPQLHPVCWPTVFPGYSSESSPEQSVLRRHCRNTEQ
ncbi:hypothetical protein EDD11_001608 [Mortierella claussenii]|nr:hypothetical protein EDD11_001608 [Mortierella claussenii]